MTVKKIRAAHVPTIDASNFIGEPGTLFYDHNSGELRIYTGTPGGRLVYGSLSLPTDGTDGQVLTLQGDGSYYWSTVTSGTTLPSGGTEGQVLAVHSTGSYYWTDMSTSTSGTTLPDDGITGQVLTVNSSGTYYWSTVTSGTTLPDDGITGQVLTVNSSGTYYWSTVSSTSPVDIGNFVFNENNLHNINGGSFNNGDLTHGATSMILLPVNGGTSSTQILNYYGNVAITAGTGPSDTYGWTFDSSGVLNVPQNADGIDIKWTSDTAGVDDNHLDSLEIYNTHLDGLRIKNTVDSVAHEWKFGKDKNLYLPEGGIIKNSDGSTYGGSGTGTTYTAGKNVTISGSEISVDTPIFLGSTELAGTYTNPTIQIDADVDSFAEFIFQNHNAGVSASTDILLVNDAGDEFNNFIDLGINSSNYSQSEYGITQANDGYLFVNGGHLVIGTQSENKAIKFHAGGTTADAAGMELNQYLLNINRRVELNVSTPSALRFLTRNTSTNVAASAVFQAENDNNDYIVMGVNSSNRVDGNIQAGESFLYPSSEGGTFHIGNHSNIFFYTNTGSGYAGTPTLALNNLDETAVLDADFLPHENLTYNLGSIDKQWRSLYVGTATIYIGGVPISINTSSNTLVIGTSTNTTATQSTNLATENFVVDYFTQNSAGLTGWTIDAFNSLIPNSDNLQDIGTLNNRVRHIYVGPGSITVGNSVITESDTGKLVLPGLTRGSSFRIEEVEDTDDQTYSFGSDPIVIDNAYFAILNGSNPPAGYTAPEYSVDALDDDGFIDGINVDSQGSGITQTEANLMRSNMWAYVGTDPDPINNFVSSDWQSIPFSVRAKAEDVEYEFEGGGGADLGKFKIYENFIGTTDDEDGWGGYDMYLSPNGEGYAYLAIPTDSNADETALSIWNYREGGILIGTSNNGEVRIHTESEDNVWTFKNDGTVDFPGLLHLKYNGSEVGFIDTTPDGISIGGSLNKVVAIQTDNDEDNELGQSTWLFKANGSIEFPDGSLQTTAYTGGEVSQSVPRSDTAPISSDGQLWFNTEEGRMYIMYNEQWVDASPTVLAPPEIYLDEITINGSTININGSTLAINTAGVLLVNGSEVTSTHIEYTDTATNYTSTVDLAYNFAVDTDNSHMDLNGAGDWEIGSNNFSTKIYSTSTQGGDPTTVVVMADNQPWTFGTDGTLTLPSNLSITPIGNFAPISGTAFLQASGDYLMIASTGTGGSTQIGWTDSAFAPGPVAAINFNTNDAGDVKITTGDYNNTLNEWTFNSTGTVTFPDTTVQATAYRSGQQTVYVNTASTVTNIELTALNGTVIVIQPEEGYTATGEFHNIILPATEDIALGTRITVINMYNGTAAVAGWPGPGYELLAYQSIDLVYYYDPGYPGNLWWVVGSFSW